MTDYSLGHPGAISLDGSPSRSLKDLERMVSDAERLLVTATALARNSHAMDNSTTVEISGRLSDAAFSCRVAGAVLKSRTMR